MGIKVIPRSVAVLQLGGAQIGVDIDHTEDSISLGDGTHLVTLQDAGGGVWALPVMPIGGGDASAANQTSGDQKTQLWDDVLGAAAELDDVGGEKALKVSVIATVGGGSGGTAVTDQASFTAGATQSTPISGQYDADGSADLSDGQIGMIRASAERALHVVEQSPITGFATSAHQVTQNGYLDGLEGLLTTIDADTGSIDTKMSTVIGHVDGLEGLIGTTNSTLTTIDGRVDGIEGLLTTIDTSLNAIEASVAAIDTDTTTIIGHLDGVEGLLTSIEGDTSAIQTAVQLMDNSMFVDNAAFNDDTDYVNVTGGVYDSAPTALASGDAGYFLLDTNHRQDVVIGVALPAGTNNIGDVDIASSVTLTVQGTIAHGTASSTAPNQIGLHARNTNPTAVDNGDVVYALADLAGRQVVTFSDRALTANFVGDIATTTEETMITQTASIFNDLTSLVLTNSNTTTDAVVFLRDTTGGSTVWQHNIPARGGIVVNFNPPMKQTTVNTNWTIDLVGNTSTVYYSGTYVQRVA